MKSSLYNSIRLAAGLLTLLVVLVHQYLPQKRFLLFPNEHVDHAIYGAEDEAGMSSASWIDEDLEAWRCDFADKANFFCGYSLFLPHALEDVTQGHDFSGYEGLNVSIRYEGEAQRLRVFLRNYSSAYAGQDVWDSTKFMSINTLRSDLVNEAFFSLSEFSVADWWILARDIGREHAAPEFTNVVSFGIDFLTPGVHKVKVEKIEFVGAWVAPEQLYFSIIMFWLALVFWEGAHRFYLMRVHSSKTNEVISNLVSSYQRLEVEKREYRALSTTDTLTGIMNRSGIDQFLKRLFDDGSHRDDIGVILLDVDHFKDVNDTRGHDAGDRILQQMSRIVLENTRQHDAFGRWGGEEFILICPQSSPHSLHFLAEKLRQKIASHVFEPEQPLQLTVSMGATIVAASEAFEAAFKRADEALYEAKRSGRNRVELR